MCLRRVRGFGETPSSTLQYAFVGENSCASRPAREIRRGRSYDGIILDPPKYGRGPKGERWRIETDLVPLLDGCRQILSDTPRFLLLTIYAIRASSQAAHYALSDVMAGAGGTVSSGELVSVEAQPDPRVIAQANYARWAPEDQETANC